MPAVALALVRQDANLAMQIGSYCFNGGTYDIECAESAYKRAVAIDPKILWGNYQIARIYFVRGEFNQALEYAAKELAANPANLRTLYVRGLIYGYRGQAGDLEKAEADFRRFTQWAPAEWAGYNDLAWILAKQGKYREIKETLLDARKKTIPSSEKNPWLWNSLGVAELNLKEYAEAKKSFEKAQLLAEKLTLTEWQKAYPGNNPAQAQEGLAAFLKAINGNFNRAESKQ